MIVVLLAVATTVIGVVVDRRRVALRWRRVIGYQSWHVVTRRQALRHGDRYISDGQFHVFDRHANDAADVVVMVIPIDA